MTTVEIDGVIHESHPIHGMSVGVRLEETLCGRLYLPQPMVQPQPQLLIYARVGFDEVVNCIGCIAHINLASMTRLPGLAR